MCKFYICLNELLENFNKARATVGKKVKICAVIKANAYGFGASKVVRLLNSQADYFAVSRLTEFLKIKDELLKPCLILTPLSEKDSVIAIKNGAEITLCSHEHLPAIERAAREQNTSARVHIKLDTGMNRFGIKTQSELESLLKELKKYPSIRVVGAFSHLYDAQNRNTNNEQRKRFLAFKQIILSFGLNPIFHLANSEGLKEVENRFDMVRLGFDLYSGKKTSEHKFAMTIGEIKEIKRGEIISYGGNYKAKKNMKIAICLAGYADGVRRGYKGSVLINGQEAKIVGNICMDCFMADISKITGVKVGDEVVMFGKSQERYISVCDVAKLCDTIPYEIYTNISQRVKRVYFWRKNASYRRQISSKEAH